MGKEIVALAKEVEPYVLETRRWLHQHAELSWQEWETTQFIEDELKKMGLEPHRFDAEHPGLWCMIYGGQATETTKTILLRADIDALPVMEDVPTALTVPSTKVTSSLSLSNVLSTTS